MLNVNLQLHEKYWLCAAIDGEGTISTSLRGKISTSHARVSIYNTDIRFIQYASKLIGKPVVKHSNGIDVNPKWKQCYKVTVSGLEAQELLRNISEYLIIKKDKADIILSMKIMSKEEQTKYLNSIPKKRGSNGRFVKR